MILKTVFALVTSVLIQSLMTSTASATAAQSVGSRIVTVKNQRHQNVQMTLREAALRIIPQRPLTLALDFYDRYGHDSRFGNKDFLTIIDYRIRSSQKRMFILNLRTGEVEADLVAHGRGSDPDHDGMLDSFSNSPESRASAMGFYRVSETYNGEHGYSARLDGLNPGANENARARTIVIHGAAYVAPGLAKMGRSWGCPAVELGRSAQIIDKLKGGSILLIYGTQFESYIQSYAHKK